MSRAFWMVFSIVTTCVETLIFTVLCTRLLKTRHDSPIKQMAAYVALTLLHYGIGLVSNGSLLWIAGHAAVDFLYEVLYFSENQSRKKAAIVGGFYLAIIGFELLIFLAMPLFSLPTDIYRVFATILTRATLYGLGYRFRRKVHASERHKWGRYLAVPLISALLLTLLFPVSDSYDVYVHRYAGFAAIVLSLILNYAVLLLYRQSSRSAAYQARCRMLEDYRCSQENRFAELRERFRADSRAAHDMRHHLLMIASLLERQQIAEALDYISKLNIRSGEPLIMTGNDTVDAILYGQAPAFQKNCVVMEVTGLLPMVMDYEAVDLCIIISNALENAREACIKVVDTENRRVTVRFQYEGWLQIIVSNPVGTVPEKATNGRFFSSKREAGYGIGLESIEAACERQHGFMMIKVEENQFTLSVTLQPK